MSETRTSFRALLTERYIARGLTAESAVATVHLRSGVGQRAIWNAYRGVRVQAETARRLREWAFVEHGVEDLDVEAMLMAPSRRPAPEGT